MNLKSVASNVLNIQNNNRLFVKINPCGGWGVLDLASL